MQTTLRRSTAKFSVFSPKVEQFHFVNGARVCHQSVQLVAPLPVLGFMVEPSSVRLRLGVVHARYRSNCLVKHLISLFVGNVFANNSFSGPGVHTLGWSGVHHLGTYARGIRVNGFPVRCAFVRNVVGRWPTKCSSACSSTHQINESFHGSTSLFSVFTTQAQATAKADAPQAKRGAAALAAWLLFTPLSNTGINKILSAKV